MIGKIDKLIVIGDVHWGMHSNSLEWHENIIVFFKHFLIPRLLHIKKKYPDDNIVVHFIGDWNDNKQNTKTEISNDYILIMEEITKIFPVIMIIGNHDTPSKENTNINTVKVFKYMPNVYLVEREQVFKTCNNDPLLFLSWNNSKDYINQKIEEYFLSNTGGFCFTHLSIAGFYYEGVPVDESKYVHYSLFEKFKKVYTGHIHQHQEKYNIMYVGSPYHIRPIEFKNEKLGIHLLDFKDSKEYFIENKVSPRYKHISLFRIMNMNVEEANDFVRNNYITIFSPTELYSKINIDKINSVLSGYKTIEHITTIQKLNKDNIDIDTTVQIDEMKPIDIGNKFIEYIESLDIIPFNKTSVISVTDEMKKNYKDDVDKHLKMAEGRMIIDEIEL